MNENEWKCPEFISFNNEQKMNGNDKISFHLIMNRK